jgi:hypothetical protein
MLALMIALMIVGIAVAVVPLIATIMKTAEPSSPVIVARLAVDERDEPRASERAA